MIEIKPQEVCEKAGKGFMKNEMSMEFDAISNNESFARVAVAAFVTHLNPTLEELSDIKTAVSEAVTNAIIHGYENVYGYGRHGEVRPVCCKIRDGKVYLRCRIENGVLYIEVEDKGVGMENVDKAMARRVVDFLSGCVYALDGDVKKIAQSAYLFCPHNMEIQGDLETLQAEVESYV